MTELLQKHGDLLTRLTIWVALSLYAIGTALLLLARGRPAWLATARVMWTAGCVFFLAHVWCAFQFFHQWSHVAAYEETARQTAEITGIRSGSGLYLNYLFGLLWIGAVLWWWIAPGSFLQRPRWVTAAWHGFIIFMIFNGTVVFGSGPVRSLGGVICGGLAILWLWQTRPGATYARK
jgi:hypothetical protein